MRHAVSVVADDKPRADRDRHLATAKGPLGARLYGCPGADLALLRSLGGGLDAASALSFRANT